MKVYLYLWGRIKHAIMSKIIGREREIEELNELYSGIFQQVVTLDSLF